MVRYVRNFKLIQQPASNDIFDALPHQIYALRKAIGWTSADLGNFLDIGVESGQTGCRSVANWERGRNRPRRVVRAKMVALVEQFRDEYLKVLERISIGPKRHMFVPIVQTSVRGGMRNRLRLITPEQQDKINGKTGVVCGDTAVGQGVGGMAGADGAAERVTCPYCGRRFAPCEGGRGGTRAVGDRR